MISLESKREKLIRFFLIGFFICLTASIFLYKYKGSPTVETTPLPKAVVLHKSVSEHDNPLVALYEYKQGKHVLAIYEIERNNLFRFKSIHAISLKNPPLQLALDELEGGVWVEWSEDWVYYNSYLEKESRSTETKNINLGVPFITEMNESEKVLTFLQSKRIIISKQETPYSIHSLSVDDSLWLLLTDKGVKISIVETK